MYKKLIKLASLVLAAFLTVSALVPVAGDASAMTASQIVSQIKRTYSKARSSFGRSFDGYCGTLTGYQLYLLGLTSGRDRQNGKDGFDNYCNQEYSSGGYRIKAYSGSKWTLKEALNEITDNGTRNAYNILVGFESTPSRAGRKYGHSCVIHGIIDGTVYFIESYPAYVNGQRYREGAPIGCSIDEFVRHCKATTTKFDGVIHFGAKDYADECDSYPTFFEGTVEKAAEIYSQPCLTQVDSSSELLDTLDAGEKLTVVGVIENTEGEFWYQLQGEEPGYLPADQVEATRFIYEDVTAEKLTAPTVLHQGNPFNIKGELQSEANVLYTVRSQVFSMDGEKREQVFATSDMVDDNSYTLNGSTISRDLAFRNLTPGSYRYELAAIIGSYYYGKEQLQVRWETVSLWNSDFSVTEKKSEANQITFDACDGTASVNQISVVDGDAIGTMPTAQRGNEVFLGWYTGEKAGERITDEFIPQEDMTLYARFSTPEELEASADNFWYIYADGITAIGCAEVDGMLYYFTTADHTGLTGSVWSIGY